MSAREPWVRLAIRPAVAADADTIGRFLAAMDRDGLYERHFAHGEAPNRALIERLGKVDGDRRAMYLAVGADNTAIGHAEYVASAESAEFALMVLPARRGAGIGAELLGSLLAGAARAGLAEMHGIIQATNTRAIRLARKLGFQARPGDDRTTVIVSRQCLTRNDAGTQFVSGQRLMPPELLRHDPDRTSLHRRPRP
ncbi:MAG: GNAT family N-acetyltransferase [Rhodocyclales bacterium]|nr:GNAT family N-acetyltransferase [Rhodocyclales bacterium]